MNSKKNILMISQAAFPPDIRLEKEIKSLAEAGYKVVVVCNQYNKESNPVFNFCEIVRVKALFKSQKLNRIINFPIFFNPRFLLVVFKSILRFKVRYLHAHDLPMVPIALIFGKLFQIPVIFDMHENYPAALRFFDKKGIINFVFKNPKLSAVLEKYSIKWSNKIIVVVDESKDRLLKSGVDEGKIKVVSNTVELKQQKSESGHTSEWPNEFSKLYEKKILLYTGRVSIERGLDTAILAMSKLQKNIPEILLLIVGDGDYVKTLSNLVQKNELENVVQLQHWPGQHNLSFFFNVASVCIIPQPRNDFINTTIPHKLFEYMLQEKPVLTSDAIPFERILNETNCGLCFKSDNPESFAEVTEKILSSNVPFGQNGLKAVHEKYNWANDAKVLIQLYNDLESK